MDLSKARSTLYLESSLTIRDAAAIHARLREALHLHAELEIDCASDAETDLTFVQLLIAAGRFAEAAGKRIALSAAARQALRETLANGGFLPAPELGPTGENWLAGAFP